MCISLSRIYIYIYIYCHPQTYCFVRLHIFSGARLARCLKLGSNPAQIYTTQSKRELPLLGNYKALCSSFRLFKLFPYRIPECSISLKSFRVNRNKDEFYFFLNNLVRITLLLALLVSISFFLLSFYMQKNVY